MTFKVFVIFCSLCTLPWIRTINALNPPTQPLQIIPSWPPTPPTTNLTATSNLTSIDDMPADFRIISNYSRFKLFPVSLLLNAVDVALQLALEDYEGIITTYTSFILASHPQVEIVILPYGEEGIGTMPRKYAIWALNASIDEIVKLGKFQQSVFYVLMGDVGIGALSYRALPLGKVEGGGAGALEGTEGDITQSGGSGGEAALSVNAGTPSGLAPLPTASSKEANVLNVKPSNSSLTEDPPNLNVSIHLLPTPISFNSIFYTTLDMLRELAVNARTDRMPSFISHLDSSKFYVSVRDTNNPPRTAGNPPYFQAEWLMRAVAQMPAFMVKRWMFRECEVDVEVEGIRVGEIKVSRRRLGEEVD